MFRKDWASKNAQHSGGTAPRAREGPVSKTSEVRTLGAKTYGARAYGKPILTPKSC